MKKAIIIGATSGIGQEVAKCLLLEGWKIGVAGRRQSSLENLQRAAPDQIQIQALDVTQEDVSEKLNLLIDKLGGMDLFLLSSGIGFQNMDLNMEVELNTAHTNVEGFIRMVDTAFMYFKKNGGGHLAVIELTSPSHFPMNMLFKTYSHWVMPTIGRFISKDKKAYRYLPQTMEAFPKENRMKEILEKAGFKDVKIKRFTFGISMLYMASK